MRSPLVSIVVMMALGLLPSPARCKGKKKKASSGQDAFEVVSHIPSTSGTVTRFLTTQHYGSYYLYVEHEGGRNVTLIDISKAAQPLILADLSPATGGESASLFAVAGTAALTIQQLSTPEMAPQTTRIMDFSDPRHPKIAREFAGVTAISRDERRGLIFLANPDGIWILRQNFAIDPEVEKEYGRHVLYDH